MSTENENWHDNSDQGNDAGRDGNRSFNRENNYNRNDGYNNERGENYSRPSFNNKYNNGDRPPRPRFSRSGDDSRPRFNREGNDRPRFNNREGGYEDRPRFSREGSSDRPRFNREGGNDRPRFNREDGNSRPRFNTGSDRPRYNNREDGDRSYNRGGNNYNSYNRDNADRPQRPSFNRERNYNRDERPRWQSQEEGGDRSGGFRKPRPNSVTGGNSYHRNDDGRSDRPRFNSNRGGQGGFSRPRLKTDDYDPNAKYSRKKQIEYKEQFVDPNEPIRLNKFLANAGVCSRREADEFITAGVVSVNGVVITELGTKIKRSDEVKFHDQAVSVERKVYVVLNKPKDCVTTSDDPQERRTVMDLVKNACDERIYPVGRLDRNTTGVLLLTNDGDLASKLTHPKYLKKKIYHVFLDKNVTKADMDQIISGIQLEDGEIHADAISYASDVDKSQVGIEIHSGKNRVVRRIFESLGYRVVKLDRVFFAGLTKKNLRRGDWRFLTEQEVNFLRMGSFE